MTLDLRKIYNAQRVFTTQDGVRRVIFKDGGSTREAVCLTTIHAGENFKLDRDGKAQPIAGAAVRP